MSDWKALLKDLMSKEASLQQEGAFRSEVLGIPCTPDDIDRVHAPRAIDHYYLLVEFLHGVSTFLRGYVPSSSDYTVRFNTGSINVPLARQRRQIVQCLIRVKFSPHFLHDKGTTVEALARQSWYVITRKMGKNDALLVDVEDVTFPLYEAPTLGIKAFIDKELWDTLLDETPISRLFEIMNNPKVFQSAVDYVLEEEKYASQRV